MASSGRGSFRKSQRTFVGGCGSAGSNAGGSPKRSEDRAQQVADIATASTEGICRTAHSILLKKMPQLFQCKVV